MWESGESEERKDAKRWKTKERTIERFVSSEQKKAKLKLVPRHGADPPPPFVALFDFSCARVDRIGNKREHRRIRDAKPPFQLRCACHSLDRPGPCMHLSLLAHFWLGTKLLLEESDRSPLFNIRSCDFQGGTVHLRNFSICFSTWQPSHTRLAHHLHKLILFITLFSILVQLLPLHRPFITLAAPQDQHHFGFISVSIACAFDLIKTSENTHHHIQSGT